MSSSKKRPAPLNLEGTKCVPGTLQTPKHLAQDITMQCLSPTLPRGITPEMLKRTQEIEAQQRQIIVQRGLCAYDRGEVDGDGDGDGTGDGNGDADCEGEDDDAKSQNSTPTSANTSSSSSVPGIMVEGEALPPHRIARSVPASATSATSRRPWELGNPTTTSHSSLHHNHHRSSSSSSHNPHHHPHHNNNKIAPHSAAVPGFNNNASNSTASLSSSTIRAGTPTTTLQERRGAKPVSLDVNALKREDGGGDPESKALDEEDEMPSLPSMQQYMTGLRMGKKRKFMELCSEMWDLLHS